MPNWCLNELVVSGEKSALESFDKAFKGRGAYWGPDILEIAKAKTEAEKKAIATRDYKEFLNRPPYYTFNALYPVPEEILKKGYSGPGLDNSPDSCGYYWCIYNWGTKWDADIVFCVDNSSETEYVYRMETAWSPPLALIEKTALRFPNLRFEIRFLETGLGFAGQFVFEGKEMTVLADYEYADDGYESFVEQYFSDELLGDDL